MMIVWVAGHIGGFLGEQVSETAVSTRSSRAIGAGSLHMAR